MTINTTTSEATQDNGNIYKHVNTQTFNEVSHKSKNEYFINGKQVRNHDRYIVESTLDNTHPRNTKTTYTTNQSNL